MSSDSPKHGTKVCEERLPGKCSGSYMYSQTFGTLTQKDHFWAQEFKASSNNIARPSSQRVKKKKKRFPESSKSKTWICRVSNAMLSPYEQKVIAVAHHLTLFQTLVSTYSRASFALHLISLTSCSWSVSLGIQWLYLDGIHVLLVIIL